MTQEQYLSLSYLSRLDPVYRAALGHSFKTEVAKIKKAELFWPIRLGFETQPFQKLILLLVFRPECIFQMLDEFIANVAFPDMTLPFKYNFLEIAQALDNKEPLIIVNHPDIDPV